MALLIPKYDTPFGTTVENAYARIVNMAQGRAALDAAYIIAVYHDKAAADNGGSPYGVINQRPGVPGATPLSVKAQPGADLFALAYEDAKTLPQLAGATDA